MIKGILNTILITLFLCQTMVGQIESFISSPDEQYLIGDQIEIEYILKIPEAYQLEQIDLSVLDAIASPEGEPDSSGIMVYPKADLNVMDYGTWQTNQNSIFLVNEDHFDIQLINNKKIFTNTLKISFWETGLFEINDASYYINAKGKIQTFDSRKSIKLIISAPGNLEEMSPDSIEIAPIKDILEEPTLWTDYLYYGYTLLSLLLIGLLVYLFSRMKKDKTEELIPEPILPAHVIALNQLDQLEKEKLWETDKTKEHQSRLTHIIREYLENRYEIRALEMTTEEIVQQLKHREFEMKWRDSLKRILQIADLVKFAKAQPPLDINQQFVDEARAFINNTKIIETEVELTKEDN